MDSKLINLALFEVVASLMIGVMVLYITYKMIKRFLGLSVENLNLAFSIFIGSILFSVGFIVSSVIPPLLSTFRMLPGDFFVLVAKLSLYLLLFFGVSTTVAIVTNVIGVGLFIRLTRINEIEELQKDNVPVAIVTGVIVVVLAMFVRDGVVLLLEAMVPYPETPSIS